MQSEGIFLVQISKSRTGNDVIKTLTDVTVPQSIPELLAESQKIVPRLGDRIQQVYYTCGRIRPNGNKREGIDQDCVVFDIDHIIQEKKAEYIDAFIKQFGLDKNKTGVVDSGYGLQFIVQVEEKFFKKDFEACANYFRTHKKLLELSLQGSGLIGKFKTIKNGEESEVETHLDTAVFRPVTLARLPWTVNHAPEKNREMRKTSLLQGNITPQAKTLLELMQKNLTDALEDPIKDEKLSNLKIDGEFVKQNCGFIRWALDNPSLIHENHFFLLVGLLKHCEENEEIGEKKCLALFQQLKLTGNSPTLSSKPDSWAMEKIIRAKPASYKTLDRHGDWSKNDPGRPQIAHPLQMRAKNFIATAQTGFRFPKTAKQTVGRIDYEGLTNHFRNEKGYFVSEINEPQKTLYIFKNTHYVPLYPSELQKFAADHISPRPSKDERNEFLSSLGLENMLDLNHLFHEKTEGFINTKSGIVNVRTGQINPHSKDFGFTYVIDTAYDSGAKCPNFLKVMGEWMLGTEANIEILQMFGGYVLAGGPCNAQTFLIMTGEGQNGKSTYWKLLAKLLGWTQGGASCALKEGDFEKSHALAALRTKNLCVIEEPNPYLKSTFWEAIKDYCSGTMISASLKFKSNIEFENRAKFIISMNQFSSGTAQTFGFLRRILLVHFPHILPTEKRISNFEELLIKQEGPGILNWFMEGYRKLELCGFKFPTTAPMRQSIDEYQEQTNMVYAFVKDLGIEPGNPSEPGFRLGDSALHYLAGPDSGILVDALYAQYFNFVREQFPEDQNFKVEAKNHFTRKICQTFQGIQVKRIGARGARKKAFMGIRVKNLD